MQSFNIMQQLMQPRPKSDGAVEGIMSDKRRWMSFLTWAFVLAEMAGRDALLPNAAHAAEADARTPDHHSSETGPIANNLPNIDVSTSTESPEPVSYQHAAQMPAYTADAAPNDLTSAKIIPVADLGPVASMGGHGGGGGGGGDGAHGHGAHAADGVGSEIALSAGGDQPLTLALGHDGSLIDVGLNLDLSHTVHGVLDLVTDTVGSLPLVGQPLEHLMTNVLSTPLLSSIVGVTDGDGAHHGGLLALPGQLLFGDGNDASGPSELMSAQGGYNSYGIEMSTGSHGASAADASAHSETADAAAFDIHFGDDLPGAHISSDALHVDQTILKAATDILA